MYKTIGLRKEPSAKVALWDGMTFGDGTWQWLSKLGLK